MEGVGGVGEVVGGVGLFAGGVVEGDVLWGIEVIFLAKTDDLETEFVSL